MKYGHEVILDVVDADPTFFTRAHIRRYLIELCGHLGLEREDLHFWDYANPEEKARAPAHLKGTTAVQFVTTSSIVIHTLDDARQVLVNVFGCGDIDPDVVQVVTLWHFHGRVVRRHLIERGKPCAL